MALNLSRTLYPMEVDTYGLPLDPFEMEMEISATITAIAGWLEEEDRLNVMWHRTLMLQAGHGNTDVYERSYQPYVFDGNMSDSWKGSQQDEYSFIHKEKQSIKDENMHVFSLQLKESVKGSGICGGADEGAPNDALLYALHYLGVHDLLSVERVCRSLRSAIQSDVLLWKTIHIDQQLSGRTSDDALLSLTNRAQANLECLSLVGCSKITSSGLKSVLERNPGLSKLNVARCSKELVGGIVDSLKALKNISALEINQIRFGLLYGVLTRKQFEELKLLVGEDKCIMKKPRYYHYENLYIFGYCEDDRAMDIDLCSKCHEVRPIYDCPSESCQEGTQSCRACKFCIKRCVGCGRCVNDIIHEENFFQDLRCSDCDEEELKMKMKMSCQM